jgi:hypothetical protein
MHFSFRQAIVLRERESCHHGGFVSLTADDKTLEFVDLAGSHLCQPLVKWFAFAMLQHLSRIPGPVGRAFWQWSFPDRWQLGFSVRMARGKEEMCGLVQRVKREESASKQPFFSRWREIIIPAIQKASPSHENIVLRA